MHPKMVRVVSSNIDAYYYDDSRQTLLIAFKRGSVYAYADVPKSVALAFCNAGSKGTFFGQAIRDKYLTTKLSSADVSAMLDGRSPVPAVPAALRQRARSMAQLLLDHPMLNAMF